MEASSGSKSSSARSYPRLLVAVIALGSASLAGANPIDPVRFVAPLALILVCEAAVVLIEAIAYAKFLRLGAAFAIGVSLVANFCSYSFPGFRYVEERYAIDAPLLATVLWAIAVAVVIEVPIVLLLTIRQWRGRQATQASDHESGRVFRKRLMLTCIGVNVVTCTALHLVFALTRDLS